MLLMMAAIGGLGVTGFLMREVDALWGADWPEDLHALFANGLLALVCLHAVAAVVESLRVATTCRCRC